MAQSSLLGRITDVSQKMAAEVHLRSLRDSFIIAVPFLVLAGLFIMLNYVILDPGGIFSTILSAETLLRLHNIGDRILNGTMNILSLMLVILIAYHIASKKKYPEPMIPAMVALAAFYVLMPVEITITLANAQEVKQTGIVPYAYTNAGGVFLAILTAILSTNLFLWVSKSKRLQIRLGDDVPPMVVQSFQAMFSIMLTIGVFALVAFTVNMVGQTEIQTLIQQLIQAPLVHLTTNLPGFLVLTTLTNLLFSLGIHPGGIINPVLEPPLLVAMQENMAAFASGQIPPHIIVLPFRDLYGHMGGTGSTLALLLAIFVRSKISSHRKFCRTVIAPGIFNINEPVIFGFPVLYNPLMMIPFIIYPQINFIIAYFATSWGWVSKIVAYVPWSVPPFISGWLGSGGDFRNVVLQGGLLALGVIIYMPFLKAWESSIMQSRNEKVIEQIASGEQAEKTTVTDIHILDGKTIILACNEGMSTSLMAAKMRKYTGSQNCTLNIYAVNAGKLVEDYEKASLILLGPQLAYMQETIVQDINHHCPVALIDHQHFSKLDGQAAIEAALTFFEKEKS
ncbi:PTS cellobiose transporter subunit IIC [Citrobacter amalonaticus]|uniref:PTS system lactose-specific EIICB component n=1 Tax=Citrobacter amalonaticus TaxID=35703 RepID=A0A2S4RTY1_CITAM|nr:PTS transporter subunit EIIC [Citrobacter amalonaticus]POT57166.1 PTS cellobiose transporter subunit IIC [Citrobacter amalonaticus]POT72545.1 PTS cellobiose transporter subunit IIC [Citrobacter amalonaticus]POU63400.1 PTS cellobiose transporter subunit IIC [Citrobacter amalonaticus]POV03164.1 PTS cellobiose transporter subunit IIC [Citrobacter amalonaticus]